MRLRVRLHPLQSETRIPINYQYPLSAAIYKILSRASEPYSAFLHDQGYEAPSGRFMKLFTFSRLENPFARPHKRGNVTTLVSRKGYWTLQIGSAMLDDFVQNFVLGLFESADIAIGGADWHTAFQVQQVEAFAMPEFSQRMRFKCLSPISASTMVEKEGKPRVSYYRHDTPGLSEALRNNLLQKHRLIQGKLPKSQELRFYFEASDRPRSKLITIKEGTPEETRRKAFESYFTLDGSPELMQTGWACGLGEENSMGFGMIEVVRP